MRKFSMLVITGLMIAALQACNLPFLKQNSAAVQTAAALTVQAQLTQAAPLATPTFTLVPFPTLPPASTSPTATLAPAATATSNCDKAGFVGETVPDNSGFGAGDAFTKTWTLQNIGTCSWTPSYTLVFVSGDLMSGPASVALTGNVNTNQNVTLSVNLTAPTADGTYRGNWGLRNASGTIFSSFWVQIVVGTASGGAFAVTHVTYSLSTWSDGSHTDCPMMTAHISSNDAGDVQYHWVRSDASASVETIHFDSASTQDVVYKWNLGSIHNGESHWLGIYVDDPNHQDFGHKTFTTACTSP